MAEGRYKAFISYSHADERWAAWLHRALESYRVPKRLVGQNGLHGPVPERLSPIFRDRDELPSSASLNDEIVEALRQSETLIVICSPAAVASRWTNEEIRQFRALGRGDRIYCMVAGGDPAARSGDDVCFPPALLQHDGDGRAEPLAADPRDWADGKRLAKLKLAAAILGVRLDELRRRDLVRRRRWRAVWALALVFLLVLVGLTVSSKLAERQERARAGQLASFIVDLGEDLGPDVDLETLSAMSNRAMAYLDDLDPRKLAPETAIKVGLALRQLGHVSIGQGRPRESLDAYQRSLELFRDLNTRDPDRNDILFERAQAEFYVGNHHFLEGDLDAARGPWSRYLELSRALHDEDPDNRKWLLEVSYGTHNMLLLRVRSDKPADPSLFEQTREAVTLAEQTHRAWPDNTEVISHHSSTLTWAGDAELLACHLEQAGEYWQQALELAAAASRSDPANKLLRRNVAYAHSGTAKVLTDMGRLDEAEKHRVSALEILSDLSGMDPSNKRLVEDVLATRRLLAVLQGMTGREQEALRLMREIELGYGPGEPIAGLSDTRLEDLSRYLLDHAALLGRTGNSEEALEKLSRALEIIDFRLEDGEISRSDRDLAAAARFQWWQLVGSDPAEKIDSLRSARPESQSPYRSCLDAEFSARLAMVRGDRSAAESQVRYLTERQYCHPSFLSFCRRHGLCSGPEYPGERAEVTHML